jgi:hypothetical protein
MNANRSHLEKVLEEINKNFFIADLMEEAKRKSKNIDQIIMAHYMILRAEDLSAKEKVSVRKFSF